MADEQPNETEIEKGWRRHFKLHMLSLEHENPSRFVHGPWRRRNRVEWYFLLYKILIVCVMVGSLFWTWVEFWNNGKWFIYLTHWGFLAVVFETLISAIVTAVAFKRQSSAIDDSGDASNNGSMPIPYKIYWCLYNIAVTCALYITVMYWTLIYNPEKEARNGQPQPLNVMVHGGNSVAMVLELIIAGPPSRLLHVLHPIAFAIVYMIFNVIYWAAGGTDPKGNSWIYEVLQWEKPGTCVLLVLMSAVMIIIIHLIVCSAAGLRSYLSKKCRRLSTKTSSTTPIWKTQQSLSTGNFNKSFVTDIP